ncbi:MAG: hypothetical protein QOJ61_2074 [Mycobacterium sp.]|nr:hypothetical protein [Mycobacterium sp.]
MTFSLALSDEQQQLRDWATADPLEPVAPVTRIMLSSSLAPAAAATTSRHFHMNRPVSRQKGIAGAQGQRERSAEG